MSRPRLNPARGAEVGRKLTSLGVKGTLVKAAELGYITEMTCAMPKCFCPEELGGAGYFAPRTNQWNDWEPTFEHYPIPKVEGGRRTVDNAVLAHRLCNKLDHLIRNGLSIEKDLARVRKAREAAAESYPRAAAPAGKARRIRKPHPVPAWRTLPPAEMAAHLLAVPTITDTSWTDAPRLRGESRAAFIKRMLTASSDAA
jgi:hypothetical protein